MTLEKEQLIKSLIEELISDPIEASAPIYQPIYFTEFKDIETSLDRAKFYEKFSKVFECLEEDLKNKKILDIGSNAGFFSFAAASRGAEVDALEPITRYNALCNKIKDIYEVGNINFINKPVTSEYLKEEKYDYGFLLSVFQWISEGNSKLSYACSLLKEISESVDTLFFELGCNSGGSAITTKKLNHLAYIYKLLRDNTIYKNIKFIGATKFWGKGSDRYLFVCSKKNIDVKEPFYSFLKWLAI